MVSFELPKIKGNSKKETEEAQNVSEIGLEHLLEDYSDFTVTEIININKYPPKQAQIWLLYEDSPIEPYEYALMGQNTPYWIKILPKLEDNIAEDIREVSIFRFQELVPNATHDKISDIIKYLPIDPIIWKKNITDSQIKEIFQEAIQKYKSNKKIK